MLPNSFYEITGTAYIEGAISLTCHNVDTRKKISICHRRILMTWIPCQARYDELFQYAFPVSTDMVHVFLYLCFELTLRSEGAIISYDIHDIDMKNFPVDISIKRQYMYFEVSLFFLIGTGSEKYFAIQSHTTSEGFCRKNSRS